MIFFFKWEEIEHFGLVLINDRIIPMQNPGVWDQVLIVHLCRGDWYFLELGQKMEFYDQQVAHESLLDDNEQYIQIPYLLSTLFTFLVHVPCSCLHVQLRQRSRSVSVFPRHLFPSSFTVLAFSPWRKSFGLSSAFFITHFIFQCYTTIISISVPSGLSTVCLPFHQSVAETMYIRNYIDEPGGKAACLSDYHFLLSGEIKHFKWRKMTFCGLPENAVSVLVINMWNTKFMRPAADCFINLPFTMWEVF